MKAAEADRVSLSSGDNVDVCDLHQAMAAVASRVGRQERTPEGLFNLRQLLALSLSHSVCKMRVICLKRLLWELDEVLQVKCLHVGT